MGCFGCGGSAPKPEKAWSWQSIVLVASLGTVLEWWDFYTYSQLDKTLTTVFFGTTDDDTGYWLIFGLSMAARPIGAILFGHVGDTLGRSRALTLGILLMGCSTMAIGVLPTYDTGSYTAGTAATVLLGVFRVLQGLAMGGEYGAAIVYTSEMVAVERRALMVALVQSTINIGLGLAVALVMVLQATISDYNMLVWGWRIPFLLAFFTAVLGFYLRLGMPEPHAFLEAARKERLKGSRAFTKRQLSLLPAGKREWEEVEGPEGDAAGGGAHGALPAADESGSDGGKEEGKAASRDGALAEEEPFERAVSLNRQGTLSRLHGDTSYSKVPMLRVLRNNAAGILLQIAYSAWVSGALYVTNSWLPSQLRKAGMDRRLSQGILLASIVPSLISMYTVGYLLDRGMPAIRANAILITVGTGVAFGVAYGSFQSTIGAWLLSSLMFALVGAALTLIGLPATRIYSPLERITGFSLGYACAMGFIGGFTPNVCNAIKGGLSSSTFFYAGGYWLLALWGLSMLGCWALRAYTPRVDKPYVGHVE